MLFLFSKPKKCVRLVEFPEVSSYRESSFRGSNVDHMTPLKGFKKTLKLTVCHLKFRKFPGARPAIWAPPIFLMSRRPCPLPLCTPIHLFTALCVVPSFIYFQFICTFITIFYLNFYLIIFPCTYSLSVNNNDIYCGHPPICK